MLNWIFVLVPIFNASIVLVGTGLPGAFAGSASKDTWRCFFWFIRFRAGAEISDVVDDFSSSIFCWKSFPQE